MTGGLVERVRLVWAGLAGVPIRSFSTVRARAVASPDSALCPPGWVGVVVIESAVLVTAPTAAVAGQVTSALGACSLEQVVDPDVVAGLLPVAEVLGPAWLSYLGPDDLVPRPEGAPVEHLSGDHVDLRGLLEAVGEDEAGESGLREITSEAFVTRQDGAVVAAAGYRRWPGGLAHLSVLTAGPARGRGLATNTAHAAAQDALDRGLLAQWRARPAASRRVAARLGFCEVGQQLSVRLDPG